MKTMKEKNEVMAKVFIMFLKANNAFVPYINAIKERNNASSLPYFMKHFDRDYNESQKMWRGLIFCAFTWCHTREGKRNPTYWSSLHAKWINIIERLIHNDYEISEDISRSILSGGNKG